MTVGLDSNVPLSVTVAAITVAGSFSLFVFANLWNGRRTRLARSRDEFAKAFVAIQEYKEFPYVIRRRAKQTPEEERVRVSTEPRKIQSEVAYYSAWLRTESPYVNESYVELLSRVREIAGRAMHDAWLEPAVEADSGMNMPDLGNSGLTPSENAYMEEVIDHLSFWPRWLKRLFRRRSNAWNHRMQD